jgi:hypothetical protein
MVFPARLLHRREVEPVKDFDASTNGRFVQARDKQAGELVWQVSVMDADPTLKAAQKTVAGRSSPRAAGSADAHAGAAVHAGRVRPDHRHAVRERQRKARLLDPGSQDAGSATDGKPRSAKDAA